ncbi:DMT family transporter [Vreelandella titanicae]|uniref:DMT family transporter n=1 Tax=Halomonadaceae TaxID=28256 RepID=UPI001486F31B|nr:MULTISPECIES: DMT family transporter [Halomonas]
MDNVVANKPAKNELLQSLIFPFFFVVIYGSGFVGAKYGLPYSTPLSFLSLRFLIAAAILFLVASMLKVAIPARRDMLHIAVAGTLTVAMFSISVFASIDMGLSPALSALIIALQPILVGFLARYMVGEKLILRQWGGLVAGLVGVAMVVGHKANLNMAPLIPIAMSVLGLLGLTFGNLYQKKFCANMNVISGGCIQSLASAVICLLLLPFFGQYKAEWSIEFIGALAYMSVGVSIGALTMLYLMIRRGEVSKVASVFYLVPVSAAVASYLIYGETFDNALWRCGGCSGRISYQQGIKPLLK